MKAERLKDLIVKLQHNIASDDEYKQFNQKKTKKLKNSKIPKDYRVVFSVEDFVLIECRKIVRYMEKDKNSKIIGDTVGVDRMVITQKINSHGNINPKIRFRS